MKTIRCPQCNLVNWSTTDFCKRCSFDLAAIRAPEEQTAGVAGFGSQTQTNNHQDFSQPQFNARQNYSQPTLAYHSAQPFQQQQQKQDYGGQNTNQQSSGKNYSPRQNYSEFQNSDTGVSQKTAIISLILGILSFPVVNIFVCLILMVMLSVVLGNLGAFLGVVFGLLLMPTALFTGISAVRKANREPHLFGGKGLAVTGIVLSSLGLIVTPILAVSVMPSVMMARRAANEASAIESVKNISNSQRQFIFTSQGKCGELEKLALDSELNKGIKNGYVFTVSIESVGCSIQAVPIFKDGYRKSGNRSFYASSSEEWRIRAADKKGKLANDNDPPLNMDNPIEFKYDK